MKNSVILLAGTALLAVSLLLSACGTARRAEPLAGSMPLEDARLAAGREVFLTHCHECHPGGEGGLGPALNNKPLPGALIRLQVRAGLGVMPGFPEEEIAGEELDDLIGYLRALRAHGPDRQEGR